MRRLGLLVCLSACATGAFAYNESVAAISYNPSRLGAYTHLKAVEKATLQGGVNLDKYDATMNIKSKGTVSLTDTNHKCQANCETAKLNTITTIQPASNCETEYCDEHATSAETYVVMQKRSNNPIDSYGYTDTISNVNERGTNVFMRAKGGDSTFTSNQDSYIDFFVNNVNYNVKNLTITANQLTAKQDLYARENYTLGKITVEAGSVAPTRYQFVERTTNNNEKVQVLAVYK